MTNCTSFSTNTECNADSACFWVNNACVCNEGYGTEASNPDMCSPCIGYYFKKDKDKNPCKTCGQNQTGVPNNFSLLSSATGPNTKCVCVTNHGSVVITPGQSNTKCVLCNGTGQYIGFRRTCNCQNGFTQQADGTCRQGTGSCTGPGQAPVVGSTTDCTCQPGYGTTDTVNSSNIQCSKCTTDFYKESLNASTCQRCSDTNSIPASDLNDQTILTKCVCKRGFAGTAFYRDTCTQCVDNTYSPADNTQECLVCPDDNSIGRPDSTSVGNVECVCKAGYAGTVTTANSCTLCTGNNYTDTNGQTTCKQCPDPHSFGTTDSGSRGNVKCVCKAGYAGNAQSAGSCVECTGNSYSSTAGQLTCTQCGSDSIGVSIPGQPGNTKCECLPDFAFHDGACINCTGDGQFIDQTTKTCKCGKGFIQNTNGSCSVKPIDCSDVGQVFHPEKNETCICKEGYAGDGEDSPYIICTPCKNNEFKSEASPGPCKPCIGNQIAVPQNASPSAGVHGPNVMCINRGTCKDPACQVDDSCTASFCEFYGQGCILESTSACTCDSSKNYYFDISGQCVQMLNKQSSWFLCILTSLSIFILLIAAITLITLLKQRKKQLQWQQDVELKSF